MYNSGLGMPTKIKSYTGFFLLFTIRRGKSSETITGGLSVMIFPAGKKFPNALFILFTIAVSFFTGYDILFMNVVGYNPVGRLLAKAILLSTLLMPLIMEVLSASVNQRRFTFKTAEFGIILFTAPAT